MEYNNLPKFRTAVGGFNRMDVVSYIESLSLQNQQTLKKLQEENSDLRRQIAQYEAASAPSELEEAAAEPETVELEVPEAEAIAHAEPETASLKEQELAAYRRAEAAERTARTRASQLNQSVDEIFSEALSRFDNSGSEANALCEDLLSSYSRLQEALADIRVIYDETVSQLQALQAQLPICVEAEDGQEEE